MIHFFKTCPLFFRVCLVHLEQKARVGLRLLSSSNLTYFLSSSDGFSFVSSENQKATLVVSAQGDAGQPGLPGTMGPAGKMVCLSHWCWARWHLSSPLMCCCVLLLSCHRVSKGCRERWEVWDLLVNLWVCLLSFTVCVTALILCICLFQTLFIIMFLSSSSSQGAIGTKGPVGPAGKPGTRVSTLAATVHQTADSSSMYSRKPLETARAEAPNNASIFK